VRVQSSGPASFGLGPWGELCGVWRPSGVPGAGACCARTAAPPRGAKTEMRRCGNLVRDRWTCILLPVNSASAAVPWHYRNFTGFPPPPARPRLSYVGGMRTGRFRVRDRGSGPTGLRPGVKSHPPLGIQQRPSQPSTHTEGHPLGEPRERSRSDQGLRHPSSPIQTQGSDFQCSSPGQPVLFASVSPRPGPAGPGSHRRCGGAKQRDSSSQVS
jgi:hypothetical protein